MPRMFDGAALVPAGVVERRQDIAAFDVGQRGGEELLLGGGRVGGVAGGGQLGQQQVVLVDFLAAAEDHRPLDHVLQFADIARPEVAEQFSLASALKPRIFRPVSALYLCRK